MAEYLDGGNEGLIKLPEGEEYWNKIETPRLEVSESVYTLIDIPSGTEDVIKSEEEHY